MNTPVKLFLSALFCAHSLSAVAISFDITIDDPSGRYSDYDAIIKRHTRAAGNTWNNYIGSDANLDIRISFSNIPTADGHSATSAYVGTNGAVWVYEQGAAAQIRTGIDPNGAAPDIYINLGTDYLLNDLWFDPDPYQRNAVVPDDKIDAASVFLHEFGHAFAFNGWRDPVDGSLPGDYQSTFDQLVIAEDDHLFFIGERAMREYEGKVPLTIGNYGHLGNNGPIGGDLVSDLMNGVAFNYGDRAFISNLDIAILADTGVIDLPVSTDINLPIDTPLTGGAVAAPVTVSAVPLPAAAWFFTSGLFGLLGMSRLKNRGQQQGAFSQA